MKAHLLVFNGAQVDRKRVQDVVDRLAAVANWDAFFGNVMRLASEESAAVLSGHLRGAIPDLNFLLTTIDPDQKGGWMPKSVRSFLNEPQPADADVA